MQFIFWQNIISIHQSAFLRNLAEKHDVTLIVEKELTSDRQKQGWKVPDTGRVKIIVSPKSEAIRDIINKNRDAWHVFSGIYAIKTAYFALQIATNQHLNTAVMLEPLRLQGVKGFFRFMQNLFYCLKYRNLIKVLLPTGAFACRQYKKMGYPASKIFQWAYFTETVNSTKQVAINKSTDDALPRVLYIGQLIARKNIIPLVEVMKKLTGMYSLFSIAGSGEQESIIREAIGEYPAIQLKGKLPNKEVRELLNEADLLILPSLFDGWGAVVNEALQAGTRIIASENCGASVLLDGEVRGEMFSFKGANNLETVLKKWLAKGKISKAERATIRQWSEENISGEAAATYFTEIIGYVSGNVAIRPVAPWMKD